MSLKILGEKTNNLFNRKEIKATIEAEITPSRSHVLELLSKKFAIPVENVKIKGIRGIFGSKTFNIEANIYNSSEEKNAVELKKKKEAAVAKVAEAQQ